MLKCFREWSRSAEDRGGGLAKVGSEIFEKRKRNAHLRCIFAWGSSLLEKVFQTFEGRVVVVMRGNQIFGYRWIEQCLVGTEMNKSHNSDTANGIQHHQDVSFSFCFVSKFLMTLVYCMQHFQIDLTNSLRKWADSFGVTLESSEFAAQMDLADPLREVRSNFTFPTMKDLPCGKIVWILFSPDEKF